MSLPQAVILGLIQGLTEFFPISSSGHLILLSRLFGWEEHSLAFDAVLHLGTGTAVLIYFWRDWWEMIRDAVSGIRNTEYGTRRNQLVLIVLASVPAGVAGLLLNDFIEAHLRSPQVVAGALAIVAILMLLAERVNSKSECRNPKQIQNSNVQNSKRFGHWNFGHLNLFRASNLVLWVLERFRGRKPKRLANVRFADALTIGLFQVLALIPGVSRSGITITAGLFRGLSRESAARFSFLLATPIVLGAGVWGLTSSFSLNTDYLLLATGLLVSFLSGLLTIAFFLKLLKRWGLLPFAIYRILLAFLFFTAL